jgi:hypothetical protein
VKAELKESGAGLSPEQLDARLRESLPEFPAPRSIPKRGPLRARIERENAPVFSTEGIVIKWANHLDAEFAESWPETVDHQPMGFARNRAPNADQEPIMDVETSRQTRSKAYLARRGLASASEQVVVAETSEKPEREISQTEGFNMVRGEIVDAVRKAVAARAAANQAKGGAAKSARIVPTEASAEQVATA